MAEPARSAAEFEFTATYVEVADMSDFAAVRDRAVFFGDGHEHAASEWAERRCAELQAKLQHSGMKLGEPLNFGGDFESTLRQIPVHVA